MGTEGGGGGRRENMLRGKYTVSLRIFLGSEMTSPQTEEIVNGGDASFTCFIWMQMSSGVVATRGISYFFYG